MNIFLDESKCREKLFPFTLTRHVSAIRIGILTIKEKWEHLTHHLIYTTRKEAGEDALCIDANIIPSHHNYIKILNGNYKHDADNIKAIEFPWQIFQWNDWALRMDFELLIVNKKSQPISKTNHCIAEENIFLEDGAVVEHSLLNASTGPVYIGRNAQVWEGNLIRGPFAMGEGSTLKMGSKIYGATTVGPYCVAGGEIKNSVLFDHSNKSHHGYLGDSVIGSWCNLGAGTSNSNVKNTGGDVKYFPGKEVQSLSAGNKAGLLMGDYSRTAINTSFNTGTIVGVCCNIFGGNTPPKYVDHFSWGSERYEFEKAMKDIGNWKKMKQEILTIKEKDQLNQIYKSTE